MDDNITCVHQHPIASRAAFHLGAPQTIFSKQFKKMVGHRTDLTGRLPGCDHHIIRDARFSGQINDNNIPSLIIFELLLD